MPLPQPVNATKMAIKPLPKNQSLILRILSQRDMSPVAASKTPGRGNTIARIAPENPTVRATAYAARLVGAVIINVDAPGLEPNVAHHGETPQVASGAVPFTVQVRLT